MCIHSTSFVHLVYIAFTQVLPMSPAHFCHLSQMSIAKQDWSHLLKSPASLCLARSLEVLLHNVYLCPQRLFCHISHRSVYLSMSNILCTKVLCTSLKPSCCHLSQLSPGIIFNSLCISSTNHSPAYSHSCSSTTMSPYKFSSHCFYSSSTYVTGGVLPPIPTDETTNRRTRLCTS